MCVCIPKSPPVFGGPVWQDTFLEGFAHKPTPFLVAIKNNNRDDTGTHPGTDEIRRLPCLPRKAAAIIFPPSGVGRPLLGLHVNLEGVATLKPKGIPLQ